MWPNQEYKIVIGNQTKNKGFVEIKRLKIDLRDTSKSYDQGTYFYNQDSFTHHQGRRHFAYFDKVTAKLIMYGEVDSDVNAEDSDTRNARGLVKTAIQNATSSYGLAMVILAAVAGLGGGLALGFILGPSIIPHPTTVQAALGVLMR